MTWGIDDWLTLAALVTHHAVLMSFGVMIVDGGLGKDIAIVATVPGAVTALYKVSIQPSPVSLGANFQFHNV
jgi:hypothetical protein